MTIVKATYTKSSTGAKASIRYIGNRPGKDGAKITRALWGSDGLLGRWQVYRMIDEAEHGSYFYRFAISPDMNSEDTLRDLSLREITEATMQSLEDRFQRQLQWVAATHDDHAPHRHVHLLAIVPGRLNVQDFQDLRQTATETAVEQRRHLDLALTKQAQAREQEGDEWERER
jgi:hypothetical protein